MAPDDPQLDSSDGRIARLLDDLDSKDEAVRASAQQKLLPVSFSGIMPVAITEKQIPRKLGMTRSQPMSAVYSRGGHVTSSRRRRDLLLMFRQLQTRDQRSVSRKMRQQEKLRDRGPDGVRALLAYVRQEQRRLDRRSTAWALGAMPFMAASIGIMVADLSGGHRYPFLRSLLPFANCLALLTIGKSSALATRKQALSSKVARVLEEADDVRIVGSVGRPKRRPRRRTSRSPVSCRA